MRKVPGTQYLIIDKPGEKKVIAAKSGVGIDEKDVARHFISSLIANVSSAPI